VLPEVAKEQSEILRQKFRLFGSGEMTTTRHIRHRRTL
jgi:hypothetical protein